MATSSLSILGASSFELSYTMFPGNMEETLLQSEATRQQSIQKLTTSMLGVQAKFQQMQTKQTEQIVLLKGTLAVVEAKLKALETTHQATLQASKKLEEAQKERENALEERLKAFEKKWESTQKIIAKTVALFLGPDPFNDRRYGVLHAYYGDEVMLSRDLGYGDGNIVEVATVNYRQLIEKLRDCELIK